VAHPSDRHSRAAMRPWDEQLLDVQEATSLVSIARDRRLVLEDDGAPRRVDLCWVDEVALALIDLAETRRRSVDLVYPAPAGQVAVLLAAELLLHQLVRGNRLASIGLVTADTTMAARTWDAIRIATFGDRAPVSEVFPCFRAGPDGESPLGGRRFQGLLLGQRCSGWPVDFLIVDHLAGPVRVDGNYPSAEVFSDPLDRVLSKAEADGRLVWGWADSDVARFNADLETRRDYTAPFSVATDRLAVIAKGVAVKVTVVRHPEAEAALARVREDLRLLRTMSPDRSDRHMERGLSIAWHHLATLTSLPCRPQRFDRFCGLPPWAARATGTFERELSAWATTLSGDAAEIATILASDIGDLRAALDGGNPFETELKKAVGRGEETLVVTRTRTASRALLEALGVDPDAPGVGPLTVTSVGRLHRQGTWPRAMVIGEPPPWDWHRVLSGLSSDIEVLVLGDEAARSSVSTVSAVHAAREHWGCAEVRGRTWTALLGSEPPPSPGAPESSERSVVVISGAEFAAEPDPFDEFSSLFDLDALDFGEEGPVSGLARESQAGEWDAEVDAVEVSTNHGRVFLEKGRAIEVRVGPKILDRRPEQLSPGDVLLVGRRQGRVGLIEALEERLAHRPDLVAARLLVDSYRRLVRTRLAESKLTVSVLYRKMVALGCEKTQTAVRNWVTEGTMAPQQFEDLERLNTALELGMSSTRLRELFAGVQRRRGFRRATGRALAAAARSSTVVEDDRRLDAETGLSIADLRDAVIEATVVSTAPCDRPVPLTLIGRLEGS
jgi:hypothetical protein